MYFCLRGLLFVASNTQYTRMRKPLVYLLALWFCVRYSCLVSVLVFAEFIHVQLLRCLNMKLMFQRLWLLSAGRVIMKESLWIVWILSIALPSVGRRDFKQIRRVHRSVIAMHKLVKWHLDKTSYSLRSK